MWYHNQRAARISGSPTGGSNGPVMQAYHIPLAKPASPALSLLQATAVLVV